jgi:hypothetical protein
MATLLAEVSKLLMRYIAAGDLSQPHQLLFLITTFEWEYQSIRTALS